MFAIGCGGGASTPEAAFKDFQAAVKAKDGDKAWNLMSKDTQNQMDQMAKAIPEQLKMFDKLPAELRKGAEEKMAEQFGISAADLKTLDGKKLFTAILKSPKLSEKFNEVTSATLENVKVEGDKATGTVKTGSKTEPIGFAKESGSWKISMPDMKKG